MSDTELPTPEEVEATPRHAPTKPCPKCGIRYREPYLYAHLRSVHGVYGGATGVKRSLPKQRHCDICDKSFDTKHGLTMHNVKMHRDPKPEPEHQVVSSALVPVTPNGSRSKQEPTFRLSKEWRIVEDDDGTPFLLLPLMELAGRLGNS